jgi:positive regulator of sigma E activity
MRTAAMVLEVTDGRARLGCEATAIACSACSGGGGCAVLRLAPRGAPRVEVPSHDADGRRLEPGARVSVEIGDRELLRATLRACLPPLTGVLAGPLLARAMPGAGDGIAAVAALAGLLLGWSIARTWLRRSPPALAVRLDEPRCGIVARSPGADRER